MFTIFIIVDLVNVESTVKASLITAKQDVKQPLCYCVSYTLTGILTSSTSMTMGK